MLKGTGLGSGGVNQIVVSTCTGVACALCRRWSNGVSINTTYTISFLFSLIGYRYMILFKREVQQTHLGCLPACPRIPCWRAGPAVRRTSPRAPGSGPRLASAPASTIRGPTLNSYPGIRTGFFFF
jgi:hypothetical protein